MRRLNYYVFSVFVLFAAAACTDNSGPNPGDGDGDGDGAPDSGISPDGWQTLVTGNWEMVAGTEGYVCVRKTVAEDTYITKFRAINPPGTHHTVLTVGPANGSDETFDCNAGTNADAMIFGSGVGPVEYALPAGVAMRVNAGEQLLLNLHLFNTTNVPMTNVSGTEVVTIPVSEVQYEAEAILMGPTFSLNVPPGQSVQSGQCTMNGDVTMFAIGPHMHELGRHMRVVAESSDMGDVVIHDEAYSFYEQKLIPLTQPVTMKTGDALKVACTYDNSTGTNVPFGDSSKQEMCFATMYRYPAFGSQFGITCSN